MCKGPHCIIQRPCFVPNDEPSLLDQIRPSPRSGPRLKYQVLARLWQKPESVVGHLPTTLIILSAALIPSFRQQRNKASYANRKMIAGRCTEKVSPCCQQDLITNLIPKSISNLLINVFLQYFFFRSVSQGLFVCRVLPSIILVPKHLSGSSVILQLRYLRIPLSRLVGGPRVQWLPCMHA